MTNRPDGTGATITHPATGMTYRRFPDGTWWVLDIVRRLDAAEIAELALEPTAATTRPGEQKDLMTSDNSSPQTPARPRPPLPLRPPLSHRPSRRPSISVTSVLGVVPAGTTVIGMAVDANGGVEINRVTVTRPDDERTGGVTE